ncbi:CLUMA_CG005863, isoform A [Clunio marinus]|uniref:CLUMA_CG005863, isoform A n=1 Tax=Clunio marinus TaxID=568069 RepID=A0A1J1HWF9_9DIPT|nr:CLUMA_CG005863, isoform A [Clunio marinus]
MSATREDLTIVPAVKNELVSQLYDTLTSFSFIDLHPN